MKIEEILDWDEDELEPETEEEIFAQLIRAIRHNEGAGWFFVQCGRDKEREVIERLQNNFGINRVALMDLDSETQTFYSKARAKYEQEQFTVLVVRRIDEALYAYEDAKRWLGWDEDKIINYSFYDLPPLLNHLNECRENIWTSIPSAIVFILPYFAVQYFRFRAPDFYDWRVGLFVLPKDKNSNAMINWGLESESTEYSQLSSVERLERIAELRNIIVLPNIDAEKKADLLVTQGLFFECENSYQNAISCYKKATEIYPSDARVWNKWGRTLCDNLGQAEDAIPKFDIAIENTPEFAYAWYCRGVALYELERYEQAIFSYEKAIELQHHNKAIELQPTLLPVWVWNNHGSTLAKLGRYDESINSFDKAIGINENASSSWYNRGISLDKLRRYEEALISYEKAAELQQNFSSAWHKIGICLDKLGRHEEALISYRKEMEIRLKNTLP